MKDTGKAKVEKLESIVANLNALLYDAKNFGKIGAETRKAIPIGALDKIDNEVLALLEKVAGEV